MSMIGKTLAHYEITNQLGKGGMGEVYQAKDRKLGRDVAIKLLPEEFARDTDRLARFQREAKLLASLNHPNIAAIYGLEESGGTSFLVLELVEGETLADRIKAGPIPVEESLKLALQIAEALEAAHEKGVIHRDLKPANIKVTLDGKVKVLDFGLAKAFAGEHAELNLSNSPTLSDMATQQGVILGTAAYMSPEQARGKAVDKRADIWAFGCVLFEMLTGRAAFSGRDITEILAAVIRAEPEWKGLPANLHWRIREVLKRCLEKEARDRCSGISDARVEIQKALADPGGVLVQPTIGAEPKTKLRQMLPWVAAALVLGLIIAGVAVWKLKPSEPRQVSRFCHELPKDQQFGDLTVRGMAISPDGRQLVYSTSGGLYLRSMDALDARLIPGTARAQSPFFSPDGKWVGYWSAIDNKLKKIATSGGAPVVLSDAVPLEDFSWEADDTIVYGQGNKIMRVSASGGTAEQIIKAAENEMLGSPQILPDGKSVLFTSFNPPLYKIIIQSLKSGERKELVAGDSAQYVSTGHIVYAVENNLFAIPFDLNTLSVKGGPIPMVDGIFHSRVVRSLQYVVAESGTLVYIPSATAAATPSQVDLIWVNREGKEEPLTTTPGDFYAPRISPDGTRAAFSVTSGGNRDIWIRDLVRGGMTRLTFNDGIEGIPVWSPDGKRIAFTSNRDGNFRIYWKPADGTGKDEPLVSVPGRAFVSACWSGDGESLIVMNAALTNPVNFDIAALSTEGNHAIKPLLQEKHNEFQPRISPDGRWMAYTSDESGRYEVYVRPFPEVDKGKWQVSTSGGDSPLWSRDGRELFYLSGDAFIAVPVKTEPTFSFEIQKILFRGKPVSASTSLSDMQISPWDISPDGKRFLMMKQAGATESATEGPRKINIVFNWTEELKQRVPVK